MNININTNIEIARKGVEYDGECWFYIKKKINYANFVIEYEKICFNDEVEAKQNFIKDEEAYRKELDALKRNTDIRYTFSEFLDVWLSSFLQSCPTVTKAMAHYAIIRLIKPRIMHDVLLTAVTPKYLNDLVEDCKNCCKTGDEIASKYLRKIMKDAYNYGLIRIDVGKEIKQVRRSKSDVQILTMEQLQILTTEASKHKSIWAEYVLALFVGLRSAEIRALKVENIDRKRGTISIKAQYVKNYEFTEVNGEYVSKVTLDEKFPKSYSSYRVLKVPEFVFDVLDERIKDNQEMLKDVPPNERKELMKYIWEFLVLMSKQEPSLTEWTLYQR